MKIKKIPIDIDGFIDAIIKNDRVAIKMLQDMFFKKEVKIANAKANLLELSKKEFIEVLADIISEKAKDAKQAPEYEARDIAEKILIKLRGH